jgi:hypothetical protein
MTLKLFIADWNSMEFDIFALSFANLNFLRNLLLEVYVETLLYPFWFVLWESSETT